MPFPANPTLNQTWVEDNTTYTYAGLLNGWVRTTVNPNNSSTFRSSSLVLARGYGADASVTFTRTADTVAYTALDVIGINNAGSPGSAIHTLAFNNAPPGALIQIDSASLTINATSLPSGMTGFTLHLYTTSPTAILDNAAFSAAAADRASYLGSIALSTPTLIGGGFLFSFSDYIGRKIRFPSTSLFVVISTVGGFTPASGTEFTLRLVGVDVGA